MTAATDRTFVAFACFACNKEQNIREAIEDTVFSPATAPWSSSPSDRRRSS